MAVVGVEDKGTSHTPVATGIRAIGVGEIQCYQVGGRLRRCMEMDARMTVGTRKRED